MPRFGDIKGEVLSGRQWGGEWQSGEEGQRKLGGGLSEARREGLSTGEKVF